MGSDISRRDVLKGAGLLVGAAALGPRLAGLFGGTSAEAEALRTFTGPSLLSVPAKESPIDHVVVLMMENRSFDHFLGWLATDDDYLESGRSRYGRTFSVDGVVEQAFRDPDGKVVRTYHLATKSGEENPYRGCNHPDPGHGWYDGRAQRDHGFVAEGSDNDELALGYYLADDVPFYSVLARRFTIFDRFHCSLLGPTFPNRHYLHCGQSGAIKDNRVPFDSEPFPWTTIWDKLTAADVPTAHYFVDVPSIMLYGRDMLPRVRHIERYFADCAAGTLPNVTFVDPGFTTGLRTDDHPHADIRAGQRFVFNVVKAFVDSPLWQRGMLVITYDEWGGFFDHVRPPLLPDDRASEKDSENFAQAGFRVPTIVASPYARAGFADHRTYDHTSILRFIEWRFLGAPPEGGSGSGWYLTKRDRYARNIGWSLRPERPEMEFDTGPLPQVPIGSPPCEGDTASGVVGDDEVPPLNGEKHSFEVALEEGVFERLGFDVELKPLPF